MYKKQLAFAALSALAAPVAADEYPSIIYLE